MILDFITHHWLLWLAVFIATFLATSLAGCNPLTHSNAQCEQAVHRSPWRIFVLLVMLCSEYLLFGAAVIGVLGLLT